MDPDTDVCQTEQPQISYSFDFTAEQSRAIQSPNLLGREGTCTCKLKRFNFHLCFLFSCFGRACSDECIAGGHLWS